MRKKNFLLCYDISDKKRLTKIAKIIEAEAMRIQRSVYFYEKVSKKELTHLIDRVLAILDEKVDDFRVYTIKNNGICLGNAVDLDNPLILL
jgi:CRISPR-associated protein Cas2